MTPMARGISDRQENGEGFTTGSLKRFLSPTIPVNRIARVLLKVRAMFQSESVSHHSARVVKIFLTALFFIQYPREAKNERRTSTDSWKTHRAIG